MILRNLFLLSICTSVAVTAWTPFATAQIGKQKPEPGLIQLNPSAVDSMDIFKGPPGTVTMHSGYMVLPPLKSVGKHTTGRNEEALITLAGTGEMRIVNGPTLKLKPYSVAYCPPATEHDVVNTGTDTLRYIWLVAKAQQ
jgi:mannose-6-phosphate isomerase-like protein (cupin superfamily)